MEANPSQYDSGVESDAYASTPKKVHWDTSPSFAPALPSPVATNQSNSPKSPLAQPIIGITYVRSSPWLHQPPIKWTMSVKGLQKNRFVLVKRLRPTVFVLKDEYGVAHRVRVGRAHYCSCKVKQCEHLAHVMLKVLKLSPKNPLCWQVALLDAEVASLFEEYAPMPDSWESRSDTPTSSADFSEDASVLDLHYSLTPRFIRALPRSFDDHMLINRFAVSVSKIDGAPTLPLKPPSPPRPRPSKLVSCNGILVAVTDDSAAPAGSHWTSRFPCLALDGSGRSEDKAGEEYQSDGGFEGLRRTSRASIRALTCREQETQSIADSEGAIVAPQTPRLNAIDAPAFPSPELSHISARSSVEETIVVPGDTEDGGTLGLNAPLEAVEASLNVSMCDYCVASDSTKLFRKHYVQFQLRVNATDSRGSSSSWVVFRRYSEFQLLHRQLCAHFENNASLPPLPRTRHTSVLEPDYLRRKQLLLGYYLHLLTTTEPFRSSPELLKFLQNPS